MLNDSSYSDEQRREVRGRLSDLKEERKARLELVTQNRKDLQSNIARIKQTVERVLDSDSSLAEKIRTIFREQGLTLGAILTAYHCYRFNWRWRRRKRRRLEATIKD